MKKILLLSFAFLSVQLVAQTTYDVTASGMSFSPNALTIEVGDSVTFTNASGSHNVNGTQVSFPSNPESFGNSIGPAGWVYGFKFTVAGIYNYKCDVHGVGMSGTITVVDPSGLAETSVLAYSIYPNPANGVLNVKIDNSYLAASNTVSIALYDLTGKQVMRVENVRNEITSLPLDNLVNGIYFCSVYDGGKLLATEKVVRY